MTAHPTVLAAVLEDRGLDRYGSFRAAYHKAAYALDKQLTHSVPSRAQFHRWLTGELRRLPYTDHCRVLEHMLAGYSAQQLFAPCPDGSLPAPARTKRETTAPAPSPGATPAGMAGVVAVYASRTEFTAKVDPISMFDSAHRVRAAGLSLNVICQQVPDQYLMQWLTDGGELSCLFLDPTARQSQPGNGRKSIHRGICPC